MLNLVQHLTASLSCLSLRTDPETSSGWHINERLTFNVERKRLEDGKLNSRGLLSLRFYIVRILRASGRRESATLATGSRLPDAIILSPYSPRVQEPAAIRPSGFPSSRRFHRSTFLIPRYPCHLQTFYKNIRFSSSVVLYLGYYGYICSGKKWK